MYTHTDTQTQRHTHTHTRTHTHTHRHTAHARALTVHAKFHYTLKPKALTVLESPGFKKSNARQLLVDEGDAFQARGTVLGC